MTRDELLAHDAAMIAFLEAGVRGTGKQTDVYPDWVYEARDAIRHADGAVPWLADLHKILGWQGGTVHQALRAVSRLVEAEKDRRKKTTRRCDLCNGVVNDDQPGGNCIVSGIETFCHAECPADHAAECYAAATAEAANAAKVVPGFDEYVNDSEVPF